ncbi:MAG: ribonuclease HII, partial [Thermoplasmata archaeon]
ILDACDTDAPRFGRSVRRLAGGRCSIRSYHGADRDHPVVGAGSILAKVERDAAIARLASEVGEEIGSGYPSDRRTVAFLRNLLSRGPPFPPYLRTSWSTVQRVKNC